MSKYLFENFDDFYVPVDKNAYQLIKDGQAGKLNFSIAYGSCAISYTNRGRLLSPDIRNGPEDAYHRFIWCGRLTRPLEDTLHEELYVDDIMEITRYPDEPFIRYGLVRVKPKNTDYCFIADNAAYDNTRDEILARIAPRKSLTHIELDHLELRRAESIIPLSHYDGNYEQPILLINRNLGFNEVELAGVFTAQ